MSIDTGQTPLKFNENYPVPGLKQSSQQFRDNFAVIRTAIENIQNITRDETGVLDLQLYISPVTGKIAAAPVYLDPATPNPPKGGLSYQNNALYYWNGTAWAPVASGAASLPGPKGETGDDGCPGPAGQQGPIGLTGPQGEKGDIGRDGIPGSTGPRGEAGQEGKKGEQGIKGERGFVGPQGAPGNDGAQGIQGLQGIPGIQGPQGDVGPHNIPSVYDWFPTASRLAYESGKFDEDVTAYLQAAIDSGRDLFWPSARYRITKGLVQKVLGQILHGSGASVTEVAGKFPDGLGVTGTTLVISRDFDVGLAAIKMFEYCGIYDFTFEYEQPSTAPANDGPLKRHHLYRYPEAINTSDAPNAIIDRVEFRRSWDGIKSVGNGGGLRIGTVRDGSFNLGLHIQTDNQAGSRRRPITVENFDHGQYGIAGRGELEAIHDDGTSGAIWVEGSLGDVVFGLTTILRATVIIDAPNNGAGTYFDYLGLRGTGARMQVNSGIVNIDHLEATASLNDPAVVVPPYNVFKNNGGFVTVSKVDVEPYTSFPNVPILYSYAGRSSFLGGRVRISGDTPAADVATGSLVMSKIYIQCGQDKRSVAMIRSLPVTNEVGQVITNRLTVTECYPDDRGSADAPVGADYPYMVQIMLDDHHIITHNRFLNWGMALPVTGELTFGIYHDNMSVINPFGGNGLGQRIGMLQGRRRLKRYEGATDKDGNVAVGHNISNLPGYLITATAFYTGDDPASRFPMTLDHIDAYYAYFIGGVPGRYLNCFIEYWAP